MRKLLSSALALGLAPLYAAADDAGAAPSTPADLADELDLSHVGFVSTAARLSVVRRPYPHVRVVKGTVVTEFKKLPPFEFVNGVFPPPGRVLTADEVAELRASPFYGKAFFEPQAAAPEPEPADAGDADLDAGDAEPDEPGEPLNADTVQRLIEMLPPSERMKLVGLPEAEATVTPNEPEPTDGDGDDEADGDSDDEADGDSDDEADGEDDGEADDDTSAGGGASAETPGPDGAAVFHAEVGKGDVNAAAAVLQARGVDVASLKTPRGNLSPAKIRDAADGLTPPVVFPNL